MFGPEWKLMKELEVESGWCGFRKGLSVWIDRPHILNKRLCAVNEIACWTLEPDPHSQYPLWQSLITNLKNVQLDAESDDSENSESINRITKVLTACQIRYHKLVPGKDCHDKPTLRLRQHLPKRSTMHARIFEMILKDISDCTIMFIPVSSSGSANKGLFPVAPMLTYAICYFLDLIHFMIHDPEKTAIQNSPGDVLWLTEKVLPKICQWSNKTAVTPAQCRPMQPSLSLVSTFCYSVRYNDLKLKYGKCLVEKWTERTDPTKYVYQVIAVASYLLVLWDEERLRLKLDANQTFVDLGCGNGLLTYILSMEGHSGIGIDVKRRKIWGSYGPETILLEQPFVPSSRNLFPEYDWIIGSHSDELTPWIPVITARSSRKVKFFLLPCCAHNFDAKFQRRNSKISIYEDYIDFVEEIASLCGFVTKKDKLRIPSTKRICIIGSEQRFSDEEWPEADEKIISFINGQCSKCTGDSFVETDEENQINPDEGRWAINFQARNPVQQVRNCTRLNACLKSFIVKTAMDALLQANTDATEIIPLNDGEQRIWHKGGWLELPDLAAKIPNESLQKLKSEFGGLKTLLRNHYQIFGVSGTKVELRNYKAETPFPRKRKQVKRGTANASAAKTKPCWFNENHPDGCPLSGEDCYFIHRENESKDAASVIKAMNELTLV